MSNSFVVFRKYSSLQQAKEVSAILKENGIEIHFTDNIPQVDSNVMGTSYSIEYEVKIKSSDFTKGEKILSENAEKQINQLEKDHYIFSFSDEELYEILLKPDEWNEMDYAMAKKILENKGKSIDESMLHSLKKQRISDLAKPEENQQSWIYAGYFFAILGGFLGIVIGYVLTTSKKTLPNGERVFSYSEKRQKQRKNDFVFEFSFLSAIHRRTIIFNPININFIKQNPKFTDQKKYNE